eukprot:CAMPEP_0118652160 /NCGR_PEP_ID=MMETSP0785-20121206/11167_1 /TAXON_ID=91992 /ORGANISM="Bolidomonas pacifica, Strain CCMP 1866" /LENGTH=175 /DNA_ID=CAMNT_0006544653 /DNA_START=28 /DNA_END=552 /DNA_ORIENTATION=+
MRLGKQVKGVKKANRTPTPQSKAPTPSVPKIAPPAITDDWEIIDVDEAKDYVDPITLPPAGIPPSQPDPPMFLVLSWIDNEYTPDHVKPGYTPPPPPPKVEDGWPPETEYQSAYKNPKGGQLTVKSAFDALKSATPAKKVVNKKKRPSPSPSSAVLAPVPPAAPAPTSTPISDPT